MLIVVLHLQWHNRGRTSWWKDHLLQNAVPWLRSVWEMCVCYHLLILNWCQYYGDNVSLIIVEYIDTCNISLLPIQTWWKTIQDNQKRSVLEACLIAFVFFLLIYHFKVYLQCVHSWLVLLIIPLDNMNFKKMRKVCDNEGYQYINLFDYWQH